jgi:hypothetical protein
MKHIEAEERPPPTEYEQPNTNKSTHPIRARHVPRRSHKMDL